MVVQVVALELRPVPETRFSPNFPLNPSINKRYWKPFGPKDIRQVVSSSVDVREQLHAEHTLKSAHFLLPAGERQFFT